MVKRPAVLDNWDEPEHEPLTIPPTDFSDLTIGEAVEAIKEWFFENFEDPVEITPYESAEGGYQYIWGGPYNTRDIIENVFSFLSEETIDAAIDNIENIGMEWVPNHRRRLPPDEEESAQLRPDAALSHAEMLSRIQDLENVVRELNLKIGIGHNNPPDSIADIPLDNSDHQQIVDALSTLKAQPVEPEDGGAAAMNAAQIIEEKEGKLRRWLALRGEEFSSEFAKESGRSLGKWPSPGAVAILAISLSGVYVAVTQWLEALRIALPF